HKGKSLAEALIDVRGEFASRAEVERQKSFDAMKQTIRELRTKKVNVEAAFDLVVTNKSAMFDANMDATMRRVDEHMAIVHKLSAAYDALKNEKELVVSKLLEQLKSE